MKAASILLLALCAIGTRGQDVVCPAPNVHCDCGDVIDGVVSCRDINEVPEQLPTNTVWLDLGQGVIGPVLLKIQMYRLNSLKITNLYLSDNKIEAIEDNAFDMMYLVVELDLSGNKIQALTDNTLVGLKSLKTLYLANNELKVLPSRIFENVPTLQYLDLENNKLTSIGREFTTLYDLGWLYLASNQISEIARESFSGLSALNHLSLFGNQLTLPESAWFRDIENNNGTAEIDRRIKTTTVYPNPWLCCSGTILYYQHLLTVSRTEKSYNQLNLVCSWPVALSGRLMASLSLEEMGAADCDDYTKVTTFPPLTTTTVVSLPPPESEGYVNFMGGMNDAGAFFLLIFFAVIGGLIVGGACYFHRNKRARVAVREFMMSVRVDKAKPHTNAESAPTRPYKQERTTYGANNESMGHHAADNEAVPTDLRISNKRFNHVVGESTDYSEDEVWNARQKRRPF